MIRKAAAAGAVVAFALSGAAFAGDYAKRAGEKFAKYDADSNGEVTRAEFLAAYSEKEDYDEAKMSEKFAKLAGDDDVLTEAELASGMEDWAKKKKDGARG